MARNWRKILGPLDLTYSRRADGTPGCPSRYAKGPIIVSDALDFVSLLSSSGVPIEDISRLVGRVSTNVTEKVYRHELRPVMTRGAATMDQIFKQTTDHRQEPES